MHHLVQQCTVVSSIDLYLAPGDLDNTRLLHRLFPAIYPAVGSRGLVEALLAENLITTTMLFRVLLSYHATCTKHRYASYHYVSAAKVPSQSNIWSVTTSRHRTASE